MSKHDLKWYVNAPGSAESVGYESEEAAKAVARQIAGADVTRGPRPKGKHRHADGSGSIGGIGEVPSGRKSLWQRLVG